MRALVLCAGFGTRLGALCAHTPKPLLEVGGRTIVEHILLQLARHGFDHVVINVHHQAEAFPARLGDGARYGVRLEYVHEAQPLGTAGTTRALAPQLSAGEDLLVHYGDILTDHDLGALLRQHRRQQAAATMLLHQRAGSNSFAELEGDGRVRRFLERPAQMPITEAPPWVFSGICLVSAACAQSLPGNAFDLPRDVFPGLARAGRLYGQPLAGGRWAIDSPERLAAARAAWAVHSGSAVEQPQEAR